MRGSGRILFCAVFILLAISSDAKNEPQGGHTYNSGGRRDPFVSLLYKRVEHVRRIGSLADVQKINEVKFQGLAYDAYGRRIAILNGETIAENTTVGHVTLVEIKENAIILKIDDQEHVLEIYEEKQF